MDKTGVPPDLSQVRVAGVRGEGRFGISIQHMQGRVKEAWSGGQSPGPSPSLPLHGGEDAPTCPGPGGFPSICGLLPLRW